MTEDAYTFVYLPGGGGGSESNLAAFANGLGLPVRLEYLRYPGWRRYIQEDFSAESLMGYLTEEIVRRVPAGPIMLLGVSLGGHFGYAVAMRLEKMGRPVSILCAIDSFAITSSQPSAGWQSRALADAFDLIKKRRFKDFEQLIRSRSCRLLLRLGGGRLVRALGRLSAKGRLTSMLRDGIAERELSMRLLLRAVAPWLAQIDRNPATLAVPVILLRTQSSSRDDQLWKQRCPNIIIREIQGKHLTLFEPENIDGLRAAFMETAIDSLVNPPAQSLVSSHELH